MSDNVIYALCDPNTNQIRYIGYSTKLDRRLKEHYFACSLKTNTHKNNWLKSLIANGQKAEVVILAEYADASVLPEQEINFIARYRSLGCKLTNTTVGGDGVVGRKWSEETKKRMSSLFSGDGNPFYGKTHSDETKIKIKAARKLQIPTFKGKHHSQKSNEANRKSHLGKKHSEASKQKIRDWAAKNKKVTSV
jgi:group I intron endonuclease